MSEKSSRFVIIPKEQYEQLLERDSELTALKQAEVDIWTWAGAAYARFEEWKKEGVTWGKDVSDLSDNVVLRKRVFEKLVRDADKLDALETAGVDNWEGYEFAMDIYYKKRPEEYDT